MRPLPPSIFLPTTAGSGSDISQFCIVTDVERRLKMSIISRSLVPNISIIDPLVLLTKSEELIVASAIDAFAHAVESYLSLLSSPFTEHQAIMAKGLTKEELTGCYACHTTGYGHPGGFTGFDSTPEMANAGCEVCHGPGSIHAETADPAAIKGKPTIADCETCHNASRVRAFGYKPLLQGGAH